MRHLNEHICPIFTTASYSSICLTDHHLVKPNAEQKYNFLKKDHFDPNVLYLDWSRGNYKTLCLRCPMLGTPRYGLGRPEVKPQWEKRFSLSQTCPVLHWDLSSLIYNWNGKSFPGVESQGHGFNNSLHLAERLDMNRTVPIIRFCASFEIFCDELYLYPHEFSSMRKESMSFCLFLCFSLCTGKRKNKTSGYSKNLSVLFSLKHI